MASSNKKSSKKEDFAFTYQAQKLGLTEALLELQVPLVLRRGWLSKNTITKFVASKDMLPMVLFCCVFNKRGSSLAFFEDFAPYPRLFNYS